MNKTIDINSQTRLGDLVTYFPAVTSRLNELHIIAKENSVLFKRCE